MVLECEEGENVRRLENTGRGAGANGKLTDTEVLKSLRRTMQIWRLGGEDEVVVDVTALNAEEVAEKVGLFVNAK